MKFHICIIFILITVSISAQDKAVIPTDLVKQYPFILIDSNQVYNVGALNRFFAKLACIENDSVKKVRILHIGDSHIQADFFSGPVRTALQKQFGCAGRGLIFPYKVANTNGPGDLNVYSNTNWTTKRNVFPDIDMAIGISGISMRTEESNAIIKIGLKPVDSVAQFFDQITIFSDENKQSFDLSISLSDDPKILEHTSANSENIYYTIKSGDNLGKIAHQFGTTISQLKAWNGLHSDFISAGGKLIVKKEKHPDEQMALNSFNFLDTIYSYDKKPGALGQTLRLNEPHEFCYLHTVKNRADQNSFVLQGIVLELTDSSGILYHMAGVNGAKFQHFNCSEDFYSQVNELKPDLIIISLGTNETLDNDFDKTKIRADIMSMVDSLQKIESSPSILLTTPSDNMIRRRISNRNCVAMADLMKQVADSSNLAIWDLFEVMGGYGSVEKWFHAGLARPDRIHFVVKGYEIQANLLLNAIITAYNQFKDNGLE